MKEKLPQPHIKSDKTCIYPGCNKKLKEALLIKRPNAQYCYVHYIQVKMPSNEGRRENFL